MDRRSEAAARDDDDDAYEYKNDRGGGSGDIPSGDVRDNTYVSGKGRSGGGGGGGAPQVVRDEDVEADPIDARTSDSDEQLRRDEREAIDRKNILSGGKTRGQKGVDYREPGDDEGLPGRGDSGSSSLRTGNRG